MRMRTLITCVLLISIFTIGCGNRSTVNYNSVEDTNYVYLKLLTGKSVEGSVLKSEPHQLTLKTKDGSTKNIMKSNIKAVKRKPPVKDDYGKGISEDEIKARQENKNTMVYGIGGGLMSFGASFFAGSMIGNSMDDGSSIIAATTVAGGGLGTLLFVNAGKAKDRQEAIESIQDERRMVSIKKGKTQKSDTEVKDELSEEKAKQEKLRQEREKLLKKLQEKSDE